MAPSRSVLLVDDSAEVRLIVEHVLGREGVPCVGVASAAEALEAVQDQRFDAVVLDLMLPDGHGRELIPQLRRIAPGLPVVVLTAEDDVDEVVACMREGAVDYIVKPIDPQRPTRLIASVASARTQGQLRARVDELRDRLRASEGLARLLGESPAMERVREIITRAASLAVTVLIQGESGTGKELAARAIHTESQRGAGPMVSIDCGALPGGLIESELFGHERGAFTGADKARPGLFEQADGGTVFLDEIGELEPLLQTRLLRVLQERTVRRVGGDRDIPVDVRVVAATHRDLEAAVAEGSFREDLYYRLAVLTLPLPPLRERGDDIDLLAGLFLAELAERHGRRADRFSDEALAAIRRHAWPGNVRELRNAVERAAILADGELVDVDCLPDSVVEAEHADSNDSGIAPFSFEERRIILRALERTGWNVSEAARRLELGRATLYRKIERHGLRE